MKSENRNRIALFYFLFFMALFPILTPLIPMVNAQEEEVAQKIYVLNGDIIKNFKFESFRGTDIEDNMYAGGKLLFESEPTWKITPDDIDLIYSINSGNRTYLYYKMAMRLKINIFTNVRLIQACSTGVSPTSTSWDTLRYRRYYWETYCTKRILGICVEKGGRWTLSQDKTYEVIFNHYDFGDIRTWNSQHNSFSGSLVMSFDIDDTPIPDTITDDLGQNIHKKFLYIGVNSLVVESSERGLLSEDEPTIQTIQPSEFDDETVERSSWGGSDKETKDSHTFDFNIRLFDAKLMNTFDEGILPQSAGSSLNPTLKDGSPLFDPQTEEKSQEDCEFTYNVGRLSPLVLEYGATLEFDQYDVKHKLSWLGSSYDEWSGTTGAGTSKTKPVALHVQNRYIQPTLKAVLNIWTAVETEVKETELEQDTLSQPKEYYDNAFWSAIVEGSGGVIQQEERPGLFDFLNLDDLTSILQSIIFIIIVVIVLYLVVRLVRGRSKTKATTQRIIVSGEAGGVSPQQAELTALTRELQSELSKVKKERKKLERSRRKSQQESLF